MVVLDTHVTKFNQSYQTKSQSRDEFLPIRSKVQTVRCCFVLLRKSWKFLGMPADLFPMELAVVLQISREYDRCNICPSMSTPHMVHVFPAEALSCFRREEEAGIVITLVLT